MVWGPTLWDQKVCGRIDLTKQSRVDKEKKQHSMGFAHLDELLEFLEMQLGLR